MNLKERVEANALWWMLSAFGSGVVAGVSGYQAILGIANLQVVSQYQVHQWQEAETQRPRGGKRYDAPADHDTRKRRLDAELSRRFEVFLSDLRLWQFQLQFSTQHNSATQWRQLHISLFSPPIESGTTNNVYSEFRELGLKELLEHRALVSPQVEQLELERAMEELAKVELKMKEYDAFDDPGTVSQRVLEAISRDAAFRRWVSTQGR